MVTSGLLLVPALFFVTYAYGNGQPISPLYGGLLGSYAKGIVSGDIAAGLSANSPVFSFRYGGSGVAVVKKITVSAVVNGTAFTAGSAHSDLLPRRSITALTAERGDLM